MLAPTPGQIRFAQNLFKTEMRPRVRHDVIWRAIFNGAVVVTFVFFLFM
jgi:hypothetical protein